MNLGRLNRYESMISELHADGSDISLRAAGLIESMGDALAEYLGAYNRLCGALAKCAWPETETSDAQIVAALRANTDIASMHRAFSWAAELVATGKLDHLPEQADTPHPPSGDHRSGESGVGQ